MLLRRSERAISSESGEYTKRIDELSESKGKRKRAFGKKEEEQEEEVVRAWVHGRRRAELVLVVRRRRWRRRSRRRRNWSTKGPRVVGLRLAVDLLLRLPALGWLAVRGGSRSEFLGTVPPHVAKVFFSLRVLSCLWAGALPALSPWLSLSHGALRQLPALQPQINSALRATGMGMPACQWGETALPPPSPPGQPSISHQLSTHRPSHDAPLPLTACCSSTCCWSCSLTALFFSMWMHGLDDNDGVGTRSPDRVNESARACGPVTSPLPLPLPPPSASGLSEDARQKVSNVSCPDGRTGRAPRTSFPKTASDLTV